MNKSIAIKSLDLWLNENGKTASWLARKLEVTPGAINYWRKKGCIPRQNTISKIQALTKGAVRCSMWGVTSTSGPKLLDEFLEKKGLSLNQFARNIGWGDESLAQYLFDKIPSASVISVIQHATDGYVPSFSWSGLVRPEPVNKNDKPDNKINKDVSKLPISLKKVNFNDLFFDPNGSCEDCCLLKQCDDKLIDALALMIQSGQKCKDNGRGCYRFEFTWEQSTPENTQIGDTVRRKENKNMVFEVVSKLDGSKKYGNMIVIVGDDNDEKFVKCDGFEVRVDL